MMRRLRARPDAILVSKETITDYSLEPRRPAQAADARPPNWDVPRRAVPRRRHRAGVPVRAEGLVHGREPLVHARARRTIRARTSCSHRQAATRHASHEPSRTRDSRRARSSRTSATRRRRRPARSRPSACVGSAESRRRSRCCSQRARSILYAVDGVRRAAAGARNDGCARQEPAPHRRVRLDRDRADRRRSRPLSPPCSAGSSPRC